MTTDTIDIEVKENLAVSSCLTITKAVVNIQKDDELVDIAAITYGERDTDWFDMEATYPIEQYRVLVNQANAQKIVDMLVGQAKFESQYLALTNTFILQTESQARAAYVDGSDDHYTWEANEDGLWDVLEWVDIDDIIFLAI